LENLWYIPAMPELRYNLVTTEWVILATERAKRPDQFGSHEEDAIAEKPCPFCEGRENQTPKEIYAIRSKSSLQNQPGWDVRVVPSVVSV
jgi:UDPglucose--hexose-1-phosphate uridylyltransferase